MQPDVHPSPTAPAAPADAGLFRYDAFISYRHVEPDREWAQWLHGAMETYRVPRKLVREKGVPPRIGRVFRDEEELPASDNLNDEIESALSQSRHLIVVCSPRTPQSRWVNREVERFREMGRGDRILALLIEGEPSEAFPQAMHEIRHTVIDRDGNRRERVEEVEPLAADVRPTRHEGKRYLRRMAKLRVLAAVLDVRFDDLRQREQERRAKRLGYLGAVLAGLLLIVGSLAIYAVHQRNVAISQRAVAETQRREAVAQRQRAELELAQGTVLQGDLLGSAWRWVEARDKYTAAATLYRANGTPPVAAELGLWDVARYVAPPLNTLAGHAGGAWAVAVSPDGMRVISGGADGAVKVWDLRTGRLLSTLTGHVGTVHAVAFLPDGARAVSAGEDKSIRLWDLASGGQIRAFTGHAAAVHTLALSADGSRLLSGDAGTTVKLWDVEQGGDGLRTIDVGGSAMCLAVSTDNRRALCGLSDAKIRLIDLTDGQLIKTFEGHTVAATAVAFMADGQTVFSAGIDNSFRFWDLATGKQTRTFANATGRVSSAALAADGKHVLAGTWDGRLKLFDIADGRERRTFVGHAPMFVRQVALSRDGRVGVSACMDGTINVWGMAGGPGVWSWGYVVPIADVGFSSDGRFAFTAAGRKMELWDVVAGQTIYTDRLPGDVIMVAALCPDGRHALAGGETTLTFADLSGVDAPVRLKGHAGMILSVAVSPDGRTGVSGGDDGTARVWDLAGGAELRSLSHAGRVNLVAFSPDGRLALTGGLAGLRLWDTSAWRELRAIGAPATGTIDAPSSAAFSPDSRSILIGTQAGTLKLFDVATGRETRTFAGGHTGIVGRVAFSPDGGRAVSASDDHTLRLWDVPSGRELRLLTGHDNQVRTVAFSPDGRSILSGDLDGSMKRWDLASQETNSAKQATLAAARDAAAKSPNDPAVEASRLKALGDWYAWRGLPDWAAAVLEQARTGGADVSPLLLGRCYWQAGKTTEARRELLIALQRGEAPEAYLKRCLVRLDKLGPATAPSRGPGPTTASTQPSP